MAVGALVSCSGAIKHAEPPSTGLLQSARGQVAERGRASAAVALAAELAKMDDSKGAFEARMMRTNADESWRYPDAVWQLTPAQRQRTGLYFNLGYNHTKGRSPPIIKAAVEELCRQGFHARLIPSPDRGTKEQNAAAIHEYLATDLPQVDHAMLLGFSKGASDCLQFLTNNAAQLPARERTKLQLWINFAGVLRGSCVANWLAHDHTPLAVLFRAYLKVRARNPFESFRDLDSISHDPWLQAVPRLQSVVPGMLCINFPVLPDGADGRPHSDKLFLWLEEQCEARSTPPGPCDGLVETAASILPREAGLTQWIVRLRGSHSLLDSEYINGRSVTESYRLGAPARLHSGIELVDDVLRALPKWTLGW